MTPCSGPNSPNPPDLPPTESDCRLSDSVNEIVTVSPSAVVTFNEPFCSTSASKWGCPQARSSRSRPQLVLFSAHTPATVGIDDRKSLLPLL